MCKNQPLLDQVPVGGEVVAEEVGAAGVACEDGRAGDQEEGGDTQTIFTICGLGERNRSREPTPFVDEIACEMFLVLRGKSAIKMQQI